jgi:hypothetical protein
VTHPGAVQTAAQEPEKSAVQSLPSDYNFFSGFGENFRPLKQPTHIRRAKARLGLELLGECVMIRKSEKRWLIGRELSGVRNSVPGSCIRESYVPALPYHSARFAGTIPPLVCGEFLVSR